MAAERTTDKQCCGSDPGRPVLEDLVPIAAVIGAGCEPCAARMVERALRHGSPGPLIERTLGVIAHVSAADCFTRAVGAEVVGRMERSLRAGRKALRRDSPGGDATCCGSSGTDTRATGADNEAT
jgi:hypothetical protein